MKKILILFLIFSSFKNCTASYNSILEYEKAEANYLNAAAKIRLPDNVCNLTEDNYIIIFIKKENRNEIKVVEKFNYQTELELYYFPKIIAFFRDSGLYFLHRIE